MASTDEDRNLLARSQHGDLAAFELLVRRHQSMIHALTYRMTGSLADADDLAQETFIRAYRQVNSYHGDSEFSTWLYRIAVNACLDWRRRETRRDQIYRQWAQSISIQEQGTGMAAPGDDSNRSVEMALMRLPSKQRAAVILTVYHGLSHAEAAQVLGCSETTVSWRVFAARQKLRRWLSNGKWHEQF